MSPTIYSNDSFGCVIYLVNSGSLHLYIHVHFVFRDAFCPLFYWV